MNLATLHMSMSVKFVAAWILVFAVVSVCNGGTAEPCQNQVKIDVCKFGCSATEDVCGGLCDAGNGVCWVACEAAFGTCDVGCDICDTACDVCCADPTDICNCGSCRDDCDDCQRGCDNAREDCEDGCQIDCDGCILNCERDCESICRPFRKIGEFCTPIFDRCANGLVCWTLPFPGEARPRCFPEEDGDLYPDDTCRSFYSSDLAEGAIDLGVAMTYGTGSSFSAALSFTNELGVVYGAGGEYGCYVSSCIGAITDVEVSTYAVVGFFNDYDTVAGEDIVITEGGGAIISFATAQVLSTDGQLVGTTDSLSLGVGLSPIGIGVYDCVTIVDTVGRRNPNNGSLVPVTNSPPVAICEDREVCASAKGCTAEADVNDGSRDVDGDAIVALRDLPDPYPIGVTNVTLTVRDPDGLSDQCTATVTVSDCTAPALKCPASIEVDCESNSAALVDPGEAKVFDCSTTTVTRHEPAVFLVGETQLAYTATDEFGLVSKCVQSITVLAPDSDGDGVADCNDGCPTITAFTPTGCGSALVEVVEPPTDVDGDGVTDDVDACPGDPGPPNNVGCPAPPPPVDSDGDGLTDDLDQCPADPGAPSNNGCPSEPAPAQEIPDSDGDGVNDDADGCPDTAAGVTVNELGCEVVEVDTGSGIVRIPCGPFNFGSLAMTFLGLVVLRCSGPRHKP